MQYLDKYMLDPMLEVIQSHKDKSGELEYLVEGIREVMCEQARVGAFTENDICLSKLDKIVEELIKIRVQYCEVLSCLEKTRNDYFDKMQENMGRAEN